LPKELLILLVLFGIAIPLYTFLIGAIQQIDFKFSDATQYLKSFLILPIVLIVVQKKIDVRRLFILASLSVVFITLYKFMTIEYFSIDTKYYLVEKNAAFISRRRFGPILFDPLVFYKTSPLLVFSLAFFSKRFFSKEESKWKILWLLLIILISLTLLISATRANILSALIILFFFAYHRIKKALKYIGILLFIVASYALINNSQEILRSFFDSKEKSNKIKLGHFESYMDHFKEKPHILLFGQGFGTYFYSKSKGYKVQQTELTLLEIIRMMGIPVAFFFVILLIFPLMVLNKREDKENLDMRMAYLLYLFQIVANPLLLGSTGMLVYVVILAETYKKNKLETK